MTNHKQQIPRTTLLWFALLGLHLALGEEAAATNEDNNAAEAEAGDDDKKPYNRKVWIAIIVVVCVLGSILELYYYCCKNQKKGEAEFRENQNKEKEARDVEEGQPQQQGQQKERVLQQIAAIREQINLSATEEEKAVFEQSMKMELDKLQRIDNEQEASATK